MVTLLVMVVVSTPYLVIVMVSMALVLSSNQELLEFSESTFDVYFSNLRVPNLPSSSLSKPFSDQAHARFAFNTNIWEILQVLLLYICEFSRCKPADLWRSFGRVRF
jgi:hypothetical protein